MQISSTPVKWTIPFATNDSAKVEIPATTTDATRFSLSLGSPPLTGQPPETGGVPPQLEDFNGAMNQISRFTWWAMGGGPLPFDATWSADPNVNGYANGAKISTADGQGQWISTVDNNTVNPETVGTNWVPGYAYGVLALTGQTGGTTTLTPAQAIKRTITVAGTLTSNLTIVMPAWVTEWKITNNTTGAFTVTAKTAAGSGVLIPQNGVPTPAIGDGTNINAGQTAGRLINTQVFTASGTYTPTPGTNRIVVEGIGGGGGGGGCTATTSTSLSPAGGGGSAVYGKGVFTTGFAGAAVTVGAPGAAGTAGGGNGGTGGTTSLGAIFSVAGGQGGGGFGTVTWSSASGAIGGGLPGLNGTAATGPNILVIPGSWGGSGQATGQNNPVGGQGSPSIWGGTAGPVLSSGSRAAIGYGSGGSGAVAQNSSPAAAGAAGAPGLLIIYEYS